ncbi:MAG: DUF4160 domain-containing protein [Clostridiales bacterium]|nr:DUF4160 domain-containing protein [Clostridiales bacterium]MBR5417600.1 DUF4160 domain-containing protein [Clostridiales bacterium]
MPTLSRFHGIVIRMYYQQAEHNPPHVHAFYGEDVAAVGIQTGTVIDGYLPPKVLAMVRQWISLHQIDLLDIWETQSFKTLPPLE